MINTELLSVLEHLERERGLKREVLIKAIEASLVSAARKALGLKNEEVRVEFDEKTGEIKIFSKDKEVTPGDFGRIAAQTAKQVVVQKIREAERQVIHEEFVRRIGSTISGTLHHFEHGSIIVDLGKTEAVLPREEQSPKESYRPGDRIRAYILEVRTATQGPQIVLSRSHPGLVKALFELEVPEIYGGIVEIKGVSREAGDRSKIAVSSREEKVDPVGACVGMRGSRVKNVVKELKGEKLDIIRWNEDAKEFIAAALSPAKIREIKINRETNQAEVMVDDDQLSLAIGKGGQNVRLAAKLTGWNIDLRSVSEMKQRQEALEVLPAVGPKTAELLSQAGFTTIKSLAESPVEKLMEIPGIGKVKAARIVEAARAHLARKNEKEKDER